MYQVPIMPKESPTLEDRPRAPNLKSGGINHLNLLYCVLLPIETKAPESINAKIALLVRSVSNKTFI